MGRIQYPYLRHTCVKLNVLEEPRENPGGSSIPHHQPPFWLRQVVDVRNCFRKSQGGYVFLAYGERKPVRILGNVIDLGKKKDVCSSMFLIFSLFHSNSFRYFPMLSAMRTDTDPYWLTGVFQPPPEICISQGPGVLAVPPPNLKQPWWDWHIDLL